MPFPMLAALLLNLALSARADTGTSDLRWFADAAPGVAAAVESVLEITVTHARKPSRGFRRLPFQPAADPDAEPIIDCANLAPVPRASRRAASASGFDVCGVRILRWLQADADRLELAVTAQKVEEGKRWLEVVLDPASGRRGWLQFAPGRQGVPLMRLRRLADWVTTSRQGMIPAHAARRLTLRSGPSEASEPAPLQLPSEGDDLPVDVLGVQGQWVKLSVAGSACEREEASCPSGWALWRADDGEPRLLP